MSGQGEAQLPAERQSITHRFCIGGQTGYVTASFFPDGRAAEVFITMGRNGEAIRSLLHAVGMVTSLALQASVPLQQIGDKMKNLRFEPSGLTRNSQIPHAMSVLDYVFRWLLAKEAENDLLVQP